MEGDACWSGVPRIRICAGVAVVLNALLGVVLDGF